jgi:SAM-dependent methyltransferase
VLEMPLPTTHFDVIVSLEVIAQVEDQDRYLERAAGAPKPVGYLVITTVNKFVHDRADWPVDSSAHIRYWLDRRSFRRLLSRHGFRVLRMMSVIPMGNRGTLWLMNSHNLNAVVHRLIPWAGARGVEGAGRARLDLDRAG